MHFMLTEQMKKDQPFKFALILKHEKRFSAKNYPE